MKPSGIERMFDWLIALGFVIALWLPLSDQFFGWAPEIDLGEKRRLIEAPRLEETPLADYPDRFEEYYNDRFGLRSAFIRGYRLITSRLLGLSTEKVLIGKEGWLYYSGPVIDDFMGRRESPHEHFDRWQSKLETWTDWFQERGMTYLFIPAPNKVSIYPEHLPDRIRKRAARTRMDRLKDYLAENSRVPLFDLREPLRAAKGEGLLYHPNDSHWTDLGAFVAWREICREISAATGTNLELDCGSLSGYRRVQKVHEGDLAEMIGFGKAFAAPSLFLEPNIPFVRTRILEKPEGADWLWHGMLLKENPEKEGTLLMFHDSFTRHALIDYLGQQFRRSVFVYLRRPDFESVKFMVERENPDVVLEQMAERFLGLWLKDEDLFYEPEEETNLDELNGG